MTPMTNLDRSASRIEPAIEREARPASGASARAVLRSFRRCSTRWVDVSRFSWPQPSRAHLAGTFVENLRSIHRFADALGAASRISFERPAPRWKRYNARGRTRRAPHRAALGLESRLARPGDD